MIPYAEIFRKIQEGSSVVLKTTLLGDGQLEKNILEPKLCPYKKTTYDASAFYEVMGPKERLILLGGGHIAYQLCRFAASCGFNVIVVDDRQDFANKERFPDAKATICDDFTNAIQQLKITPYDYVAVITRGHLSDVDCLKALLVGHQPHYLGLISSKKRSSELFLKLKNEGYDEQRIDAICSPIGLNIGAKTPEEITISILAQLISYRHLDEYIQDQPLNNTDFELSIIETLASLHQPVALATVIEKTGSAPRGVGAKMIIFEDGHTLGSIGGGETEYDIILKGQQLIGSKTYTIETLRLDGSVAANDGNVCGGIQTILLEDLS